MLPSETRTFPHPFVHRPVHRCTCTPRPFVFFFLLFVFFSSSTKVSSVCVASYDRTTSDAMATRASCSRHGWTHASRRARTSRGREGTWIVRVRFAHGRAGRSTWLVYQFLAYNHCHGTRSNGTSPTKSGRCADTRQAIACGRRELCKDLGRLLRAPHTPPRDTRRMRKDCETCVQLGRHERRRG